MATQLLGTLGNIDEISIGGRIITNVPSPTNSSSTLITLTSQVAGVANSNFRLPNGSAGYQVTTGKTLTIVALQVIVIATAAAAVQLGYGDTDVGLNNGTPPTSPVYFGGSSGIYVSGVAALGTFYAVPNFQVIANKYPFIAATGGNASIIAYGYEL